MKNRLARSLFSIVAFCALAACNTISTYDQAAYEKATSAKAEALALMDKATDAYGSHLKDIESVTLDINKAYEYDRGRSLNQTTIGLWEKLLGPDRDLYGGFIRDWKTKGRFDPFFIGVKKKEVGEGFDQIIQLESGKRKTPQGAS